MKSQFHREITQKAYQEIFSVAAMETIIRVNIGQDRVRYQFGHSHFHFDSSSFEAGFNYIAQQESLLITSISNGDYTPARKALGRITHTWQDFYSHSNYIELWLKDHPSTPPEDINPSDHKYLNHPDLRSGYVYGLWDYIALIPGLTKLLTPLMPDDSHAKMNLDSPGSGPLFVYNYHAALKRTSLAYDHILTLCDQNNISRSQIEQFQGLSEEEKV